MVLSVHLSAANGEVVVQVQETHFVVPAATTAQAVHIHPGEPQTLGCVMEQELRIHLTSKCRFYSANCGQGQQAADPRSRGQADWEVSVWCLRLHGYSAQRWPGNS